MAGLLNATQGAAPPPVAAPGLPAKQPASTNLPAGDEEGNVSKEEQAQYNEFVANGMRLMHDEKGIDGMLQSIQGNGSPVEGLANTVASIVMRVEDSAEQQGTEISGDVLMHGGTELLEQAAELAEEAGIQEFSDEDLESALNMAMDLYRTTRQEQGKLPTEQFSEDLQELQAAEQDGSLENLLPGISDYAKKAPVSAPNNAQAGAAPPGTNAQPQRGLLR